MEHLTQKEAAEILKVSVRTIRRYAKRGLLTTIREGGKVWYSIESVAAKKRDPRGESLSTALANLQVEYQKLHARVALLEAILGARGDLVGIKDVDATTLKNTIKKHRALKVLNYNEIRGWADDLLRLNAELCKELGFSFLRNFVDRLIVNAEKSTEIKRHPSRRIYIDKLKLFKSQLTGYAAIYRAERKSHQDAERAATKS